MGKGRAGGGKGGGTRDRNGQPLVHFLSRDLVARPPSDCARFPSPLGLVPGHGRKAWFGLLHFTDHQF